MVERKKVGEAYVEYGADLTGLDKGTAKAKTTVKSFAQDSAKELAGLRAAFAAVAAAAATALAVKAVRDFATFDAALNRAARNVVRFGGDFDSSKAKIAGWANALEAATGVADDKAVDALNNLLVVTKDLDRSMELAGLAADLVASGAFPDLAAASETLGLAFQGNDRGVSQLARALGIVGPKAKDAGFIFQQVQLRFGGAAAQASGLSIELTKLGNSFWNMAKDVAGKAAPLIEKVVKGWRIILDGDAAGPAVDPKRTALYASLQEQVKIVEKMERDRLNLPPPDWENFDKGLDAAKAKLAALQGQVDAGLPKAGAKRPPTASEQAALNQQNAQAAEALTEETENYFKALQDAYEEQEKVDQKNRQIGAYVAGELTANFQTFFEQAIEGFQTLQQFGEALATAVGKALLNMLATYLEQKAAVAFAEAVGEAASIVGAVLAPGMFTKAATLAAAAGAVRAASVKLADGGIVAPRPGGTLATIGEAGEAEVVSPLSELKKMMGMGGGVSVGNINISLPGVRDAAGFRDPRVARRLLEEITRAQRMAGQRE